MTALFGCFDRHLDKAGYLAMGGQIVDATIVAAPKQRYSDGKKADIKAGKVPEAWWDKPAKLRQKDRDARWTVKYSKVWADTAYRSKKNETWLERNSYVSDIHHKKPKGRPMSEAKARANGPRSKVRAFAEHVFAHLKARMGLVVCTIGIARAKTKICMANLTYDLLRFVWHQGKLAPA